MTKFLEGPPPTMVVQNICRTDKPIDFFYLLYSPCLWSLIVENTKKCVKSVPTKKWKDVNLKIMKDFLAVVFNMRLIRKTEFTDYW